MSGFQQIWTEGDLISRAVAALLLLMSISAWVLIFWKGWVLARVRRDLGPALAVFWGQADLPLARSRLEDLDREGAVLPLVDAAMYEPTGGTLESAPGQTKTQLTRRLRDALHGVIAQLQYGQVLLASVGATAPFIGLFGTVWGIYHALLGISASGSIGIDKVAGPVGEALIMTAAGLAVAIPAVLAYNVFGKWVAACEADLEGFAQDLLEHRLAEKSR